MLGKIKHHLKKGIPLPLGKFDLTFKVEKKKDLHDAVLEMSFARHLETKFPQLKQKFGFELTPENVNVVLGFYLEYVPFLSPATKEARTRTLLQRLKNELSKREILDPKLQKAATKAIALSDLSEGLPDRALCLRDDPSHHAAWLDEVKKLEAAYGAPLVTQSWPNSDRGASIQYYLEAHTELLRGKKVMHFAPEASLRKWFEKNRSALGLAAYHTVDGSLEDVNDRFDIVDIKLPSESFDVIICHRVLEHIPDDRAALKELYRLLKVGGVMNFSIPQMPHRDQTAEWIIPDESHHGHVRHYGADLEQLLMKVGFEVKLEPWLLQQKREDLLKVSAYPLRMYQCWKLNS